MGELKANNLAEITAHIVAAYVEKNPLSTADLPGLIASVSDAIGKLRDAPPGVQPKLRPAVNPVQSVFAEHIVCLECGEKFASLKKHLRVTHDLTLDEYRDRWGLDRAYPVVAANYTATRSALAKKIGLGGAVHGRWPTSTG